MKQWTTYSIIFNVVFACILLGSCAHRVTKPDTPLCSLVYNKPSGFLEKRCYNIRTDYDDNGRRKPTAKPVVTYLHSLEELDMHMATTARGFVNAQAYINKLKQYCE